MYKIEVKAFLIAELLCPGHSVPLSHPKPSTVTAKSKKSP